MEDEVKEPKTKKPFILKLFTIILGGGGALTGLATLTAAITTSYYETQGNSQSLKDQQLATKEYRAEVKRQNADYQADIKKLNTDQMALQQKLIDLANKKSGDAAQWSLLQKHADTMKANEIILGVHKHRLDFLDTRLTGQNYTIQMTIENKEAPLMMRSMPKLKKMEQLKKELPKELSKPLPKKSKKAEEDLKKIKKVADDMKKDRKKKWSEFRDQQMQQQIPNQMYQPKQKK